MKTNGWGRRSLGGRGGRGGARSRPRTAQAPGTTPMDAVDLVEEADVRNTLYTLDTLISAMRRLPRVTFDLNWPVIS